MTASVTVQLGPHDPVVAAAPLDLKIDCPACGVEAGEPCQYANGERLVPFVSGSFQSDYFGQVVTSHPERRIVREMLQKKYVGRYTVRFMDSPGRFCQNGDVVHAVHALGDGPCHVFHREPELSNTLSLGVLGRGYLDFIEFTPEAVATMKAEALKAGANRPSRKGSAGKVVSP